MPYSWKLLKESVNINNGTFNIAGVKKVGALYRKELEALGFTVEWVKLPDSLKRAGHLVALKKGTKGKKLFLIGHLDTVFEPDMPANPFKQISDNMATGKGAHAPGETINTKEYPLLIGRTPLLLYKLTR